MTVLIVGGSKSGKSSLAQNVCAELAGDGPLYYLATMIPQDGEDEARIARHIEDRAGMGFKTLEQGRDLTAVLSRAEKNGTFLLDSVTALLLNELYPDPTTWKLDPAAPDRCQAGLEALCGQVKNIVLVSDYIYSDAMKYDEETEIYRRGLAQLDRFLAGIADTVIEVSAGSHIFHKGGIGL